MFVIPMFVSVYPSRLVTNLRLPYCNSDEISDRVTSSSCAHVQLYTPQVTSWSERNYWPHRGSGLWHEGAPHARAALEIRFDESRRERIKVKWRKSGKKSFERGILCPQVLGGGGGGGVGGGGGRREKKREWWGGGKSRGEIQRYGGEGVS